MRIDLNADLGEGVTDDDGLLGVVTSANLACGFHAGDEDTMRRVCAGAAERGVVVGAQVSYRDRENFGRKHMDVAAEVLTEWVAEQVDVLRGIASGAGIEVVYVKPHGALYNRVVEDEEQAAAVLAGSASLPVLGLPGSAILRLAEADGTHRGARGVPGPWVHRRRPPRAPRPARRAGRGRGRHRGQCRRDGTGRRGALAVRAR